ATGMVGLIKAALSIHREMLVPTPNYAQASPDITFGPFFVAESLTPFATLPRRVCVSSFGVGGTNAHVVVEEAPPRTPAAPLEEEVFVLSAATETALQQLASNLAAYMRVHPELTLADVAGTLQVGRRVFAYRRAFACRSPREAIARLEGDVSPYPDSLAAQTAERWQRAEPVHIVRGEVRRVPLPTYPFERERSW